VNVEPPLTPTTPKVGAKGKASLHWGKLISKPVDEDVTVAPTNAVLVGMTRSTAATRTAARGFVKRNFT
jgi:hypothetical protein